MCLLLKFASRNLCMQAPLVHSPWIMPEPTMWPQSIILCDDDFVCSAIQSPGAVLCNSQTCSLQDFILELYRNTYWLRTCNAHEVLERCHHARFGVLQTHARRERKLGNECQALAPCTKRLNTAMSTLNFNCSRFSTLAPSNCNVWCKVQNLPLTCYKRISLSYVFFH